MCLPLGRWRSAWSAQRGGVTGSAPRVEAPGNGFRVGLLGNPVREVARFHVELGDEGDRGAPPAPWTLAVYDPAGRLVQRLPGHRGRLDWNLRDHTGRPVRGGVYFARVMRRSGEATGTVRVIVLP